MTLRDDFARAVTQAGGAKNDELAGDRWSTVVPAGNGLLAAEARLDRSGQYLTFMASLARLRSRDGDVPLTLLNRHVDPARTDAAAYAIDVDDGGDVVVAVLHWPLQALDPSTFDDLLVTFARAVRGMYADLAELAAAGAPLEMQALRASPAI